ncbi:hypothetical protein SHI21_06850 [Bacteriovorax sp. PP10]|uniref:Uncharacterized protein n=1 Tax=Bacteriovorax antarcticus TaxID=3088717 RepID=A0ABU5VV42_9BACT|nr:hypothetical protein [Bacteriovorax sp. PP10]MEA9355910.1 hypothetical protein [Bacteriovorax sp. PP10]
MKLFENKKSRFIIISILGALQVASFTIIPKESSINLFLVVNLSYFFLGLISINWKEACKNIFLVTIPVFLFMTLIFLVPAIIKGNITDVFWPIKAGLQIWSLTLIVGMPIFFLGFGSRYIALLILKRE